MARKKQPLFVEVSISDDSDDSDCQRYDRCCIRRQKCSSCYSTSENSNGSDDTDSSDLENMNNVLYQQCVKEFFWDKYVKVPMLFDEYESLLPDVPELGLDNMRTSRCSN